MLYELTDLIIKNILIILDKEKNKIIDSKNKYIKVKENNKLFSDINKEKFIKISFSFNYFYLKAYKIE